MAQELVSATNQQEASALIQLLEGERLESGRDVVLVVAGKSGTGKSTLINNFLALDGDNAAESRLHPTSVTSNVRRYDGEVNDVPIRAIDMPGLHARKHREDEEASIVAELSNLTQGEADVLIYCVSLTQRLDVVDEKNIQTLNMAFGKKIWKNAIFVFTHADSVLEDEQNRGEFDRLVNSFRKEIQEVLCDCGVIVSVISMPETATVAMVGTEANIGDDLQTYKIVAIPTGRNPDVPQGWRRSLLSQIMNLCRHKVVENFLKLKNVSWGRILEIFQQAAMAGAQAGVAGGVAGASAGSAVGTVIGGVLAGVHAVKHKSANPAGAATAGAKVGGQIGAAAGACSVAILAALGGSINNVLNQDIKREIMFYYRVHRKLNQVKERLPDYRSGN